MDEPNVILNYINSGGVVALLVALLYLGYTGRVVSSHHIEKIIAAVVKEVLEQIAAERRARAEGTDDNKPVM